MASIFRAGVSQSKPDQDDLLRVTGDFGEIGPLTRPESSGPKAMTAAPNIMMISNIRENG